MDVVMREEIAEFISIVKEQLSASDKSWVGNYSGYEFDKLLFNYV